MEEKKKRYNSDDVILSLDIGTEFVKAIIAAKKKDNTLEIIGVGKAHQGAGNMYAGAISDISGVISICEKALNDAEEMAGVVSKTAVVGIAGELIKGNTNTVKKSKIMLVKKLAKTLRLKLIIRMCRYVSSILQSSA